MSTFTLRNLTSGSISITRIESIENPRSLQSSNGVYFSKIDPSPAQTTTQLVQHPSSLPGEASKVDLAPFESCLLGEHGVQHKESIRPSLLRHTAIRLTIVSPENYQYHVDVNLSYTQKTSQEIRPLSSDHAPSLTALFHPAKPFGQLTIHSNNQANYRKWMHSLPDTLPLSAISIPGTHNSHTHYRALPSVRCQSVDIKTQLDNGIRFLDIRLQPEHATDTTKKELSLVHGAFPISLTGSKYFSPILQICYDFLAAHPSETILMSLKREGIGSATDAHLAQVLWEHYINHNAAKWYTGTSLPSLDAARGKIVLIRRYNSTTHEPRGIDATAWPHNATNALFPSQVSTICLQDFHDVSEPGLIRAKIQYSNEHLVRAAACVHSPCAGIDGAENTAAPLYLNFLSASNFWRKACWPENIAKVLNRGMEEWLCSGHHLAEPDMTPREPTCRDGDGGGEREDGLVVRRKKSGDGGTGVVVMDCVGENGDWDLVRLIVGMNMGVLMKMQNQT